MTNSSRLRWASVILGCAGLGVFALGQKPAPRVVEEIFPQKPTVQPIPFSHKVHSGLGIKCLDCHPIREPGYQAGYPKETTCMGCHASIKKDSEAIRKLEEFARSRKPVPWVKVYHVPDYVWFSHASHVQDAKIACETCHGAVAASEVIAKEASTSMHSCMQCHAKHGASNACDSCHSSQ